MNLGTDGLECDKNPRLVLKVKGQPNRHAHMASHDGSLYGAICDGSLSAKKGGSAATPQIAPEHHAVKRLGAEGSAQSGAKESVGRLSALPGQEGATASGAFAHGEKHPGAVDEPPRQKDGVSKVGQSGNKGGES